MKILYLAAESANWVISLCNEFCKNGHEVTCVVQDSDEYDKDNSVEEHENLTRVNVSMEHFFIPAKMKSALAKELTTKKFDIVFGSHAPVSSSVKEISEMKGIPWGIMLLDIPKDLMERDRKRMLQWTGWFDMLKYANQIIFNTHVARDVYYDYTKQWFSNDNVITYGTAFKPEYFKAGKDIKGDYIVSMCRLTNVKAVSNITIALAPLNVPLKQVVVGRDRGDLENIKYISNQHSVEIEHYENVTENEKYELIKNSAMVIYPQRSEYIGGLNPWEAMYVGKPVICYDYKVLKDLYGNDGVQYVDKNAGNGLSRKILEVYYLKEEFKDEAFRLNENAEYAADEASFKTMAERMELVFQKMVR